MPDQLALRPAETRILLGDDQDAVPTPADPLFRFSVDPLRLVMAQISPREYIALVRGREVVRSDEIDFLTRLGLAAIVALRELWKGESMPVEKAVPCSTWLQRSVLPSPIDWMAFGDPVEREEAFVQVVIFLVRLIPIFGSRQAEYSAWLDREVLAPLAPAAPELLDRIATEVADYVSVNSEELARDGA